MIRRAAVAFGRFWWDFLVGDTPELFVGAVATVGLIALLCTGHGLRSVSAVVLPLLVIALLTISVWRAGRKRPAPDRAGPDQSR